MTLTSATWMLGWYLWIFSTRLARASPSPQKAGGWYSAVSKPIHSDCPRLRLLNCLPAPTIPSPNLTAGDSNHSWQKQQAQEQQLRAGPEASKHHGGAHVKRSTGSKDDDLGELGSGALSSDQWLLGPSRQFLSSLPAQSGNLGYRMRKCSAEAMTLGEQ